MHQSFAAEPRWLGSEGELPHYGFSGGFSAGFSAGFSPSVFGLTSIFSVEPLGVVLVDFVVVDELLGQPTMSASPQTTNPVRSFFTVIGPFA